MHIAVRTTQDEEELVSTLTLLNGEIDEHQRQLFSAMDGIDSKATVVAGFSAAAVSFLLGEERAVLWRLALAAYAIALIAALAALRPRGRSTVRPDALLRLLGDAHVLSALRLVARAKADSFAANYRQARVKAMLWTAGVGSLLIGLVLSVWSVMAEEVR